MEPNARALYLHGDAGLKSYYLDLVFVRRYSTIDGGVRVGRLLEDMDIFAVHLGNHL